MKITRPRSGRIRRRKGSCCYIDSIDDGLAHCLNIRALANLLSCCNADELNPDAVSRAGFLIFQEAEMLRDELETLHERLKKL